MELSSVDLTFCRGWVTKELEDAILAKLESQRIHEYLQQSDFKPDQKKKKEGWQETSCN